MASTEQRYSVTIHYGRTHWKTGRLALIAIGEDSLELAMEFVRDFKCRGYHVQQVHGGLTSIIPWHSVVTIDICPLPPA